MSKRKVIVLTGSKEVVNALQARYPGEAPRATHCLETLPAPLNGDLIYIDPRAVNPCCLRLLRRWGKERRTVRAVYLSVPAPAATLLALSGAYPGEVESLDDLRGWRHGRRPVPRSRLAWRERQRVLSWQPQDARQRQFLSLAFGVKGFGRPESEIAAEMGLSTRHLCRLVRSWLGYTPKVVLDLVRLENVAGNLTSNDLTLNCLAASFGFGTRRTLTRQFRAFTGQPPSVHRRHSSDRSAEKSASDPSMS